MAFDRNDGYYLSASLLRKLPYDYSGMRRFVEHIQPHTSSIRADLMSLRDTTMTEYGAILANELHLRGDVLLQMDDLDYEIVSNLHIRTTDDTDLLLSICFLDDDCYEINLSLPSRHIRHDNRKMYKLLESMATSLVNYTQPLYACLGIESNICSLAEIATGEFFAITDQLYFCSGFINQYGKELHTLLDGYRFKSLQHGQYCYRGEIGSGKMLPNDTQQQIGNLLSQYINV